MPKTEVPLLNDEQRRKIIAGLFADTTVSTDDDLIARAIKQAVRAPLVAEIERQRERREAMHNAMHSERDRMDKLAEKLFAERDAALSQAVRLRALLRTYIDCRDEAEAIDDVLPDAASRAWVGLSKRIEALDAEVRAALQPQPVASHE